MLFVSESIRHCYHTMMQVEICIDDTIMYLKYIILTYILLEDIASLMICRANSACNEGIQGNSKPSYSGLCLIVLQTQIVS